MAAVPSFALINARTSPTMSSQAAKPAHKWNPSIAYHQLPSQGPLPKNKAKIIDKLIPKPALFSLKVAEPSHSPSIHRKFDNSQANQGMKQACSSFFL